jgi:hypothetical protein
MWWSLASVVTEDSTTDDRDPPHKVRIAPSPLWETVTSFGVLLHHQGCDTVHAPWAVRARRVLPGTDISALVAAMCGGLLSGLSDASPRCFGH